MSYIIKLVRMVLYYKVVANPDKVYRYTIRDQSGFLEDFFKSLSVNHINLPFKIRVEIYKLRKEQETFLEKIENAPKNYSGTLLEEEYKNMSDKAEEFILSIAEIFDDPYLWVNICGKKSSQNDIIEKWSILLRSLDWLKDHGFIATKYLKNENFCTGS